jgi:hypothetical protein
LSEINNEEAKQLASIQLQEEKVMLCKKKLQNVMDGDSGMMEGFKAIKSVLKNVRNVAKTQMNQMEGSERANTMEKIQAKWVV